MWHLIRLLFVLVVILGIALIGYAYIVDLSPPEGITIQPIEITED